MTSLHERILSAHGGAAAWAAAGALEVELTATGFLFAMKLHRPLGRVRVIIDCTAPRVVVTDYPTAGQRGEWYGDGAVQVMAADGTLLTRRWSPRDAFFDVRHELWWDDLDFLYFAGYALWNYFTMPKLLTRSDVTLSSAGTDPVGERVTVRFPAEVPTHSREQTFWFDERGELKRLDYTTEVLGPWATAAHLVSDYREFGALRFPTRRWVRPKLLGSPPLPFPDLVAMTVHSVTTHPLGAPWPTISGA